MSFSVIVKISKQKIGFWYQLEGSDYFPLLMKNEVDIPLYFYVNGNDFIIGNFAKDRANLNDPNAFSNYFEIVKDPSKFFSLHGDTKPVKQLLYYGIENYLSYFIKTILYKNDSIESYRNNFCLRFWFDYDIVQPEKILVEHLFKEAGYENVSEIDSDSHLNMLISNKINNFSSRLIMSAIENDLYVKLFGNSSHQFINQIKIEGQGSDPRAKILAQLILEDIKESFPHLNIDNSKEIPFILNHCINLLRSLSPLMRNDITLNSGKEVSYKIKLKDLDDRILYNRGVEDKIIPQLTELISQNNFSSNSIDLILIGNDINTSYFKDRLLKKFKNVNGFDNSLEKDLLKSFFNEIRNNNFKLINSINVINSDLKPLLPPLPPKPHKQVVSTSSGQPTAPPVRPPVPPAAQKSKTAVPPPPPVRPPVPPAAQKSKTAVPPPPPVRPPVPPAAQKGKTTVPPPPVVKPTVKPIVPPPPPPPPKPKKK
jgi:hypothetical protein